MPEPISLERNVERLAGLWPSAGFSHDWIALFRKEFRDSNQHWLAEAMENVKRTKASHVPELKWFLEEFREIGRRFSGGGEPAMTREEIARRRAEELERERRIVELDRKADREFLERAGEPRIAAAFDRLERTVFRDLARHRGKPIDEWTDNARGMVAAAIRNSNEAKTC